MRIPSFLIKLHQRVKSTRVWRHRWKIVSFTPFVIAGLIFFLFYFFKQTVRNNAIGDARDTYSQLTSKWAALGESRDIYDYFPADIPSDKDFLAHSAFQEEFDQKHSPPLADLHHSGLTGFSSDASHYWGAGYNEGKLCDIRLWLNPASPTLTLQECASRGLDLLQPFNQRLDSIAKASHREAASFSPLWKDSDDMQAQSAILKTTADLLAHRATLHIYANQPDKALEDIQTMHRVFVHYRHYPCLLGLTYQTLHYKILERAVVHGLHARCWNKSQLQSLAHTLDQVDLQKSTFSALKGETAYYIHFAADIINNLDNEPSSQLEFSLPEDYSLASLKNWYQIKKIECAPEAFEILHHNTITVNLADNVLYPGRKANESLAPILARHPSASDNNYYIAIIAAVSQTTAHCQNLRTAIALERFRLENGSFPKRLHSLVPEYLPSLPTDIFSGKPTSYKLQADGSPLIWSVGKDLHDDSGDPDIDIILVLPPTVK